MLERILMCLSRDEHEVKVGLPTNGLLDHLSFNFTPFLGTWPFQGR